MRFRLLYFDHPVVIDTTYTALMALKFHWLKKLVSNLARNYNITCSAESECSYSTALVLGYLSACVMEKLLHQHGAQNNVICIETILNTEDINDMISESIFILHYYL
jgi:hypothetical protein